MDKQKELEIVELIVKTLDSKKGNEISTIEVGEKTVLADYFIMATGTSNTQVRALADEVEYILKTEMNISPNHVEGKEEWILIDYGFIIVHVFTEKARRFYNIDKLWKDAADIQQ